MDQGNNMKNSIKFSIEPIWKNIEVIRKETETFLLESGVDENPKDAIIMSLSELLENAIKYGNFSNHSKNISATISILPKNITVEVTSPMKDQDDANFRRLDKTIQWIRGYQNPFEAYIEKLKEISIRSLADKENGLGITRIAYEGQSIVDFYLSADDTISVSAVYLF